MKNKTMEENKMDTPETENEPSLNPAKVVFIKPGLATASSVRKVLPEKMYHDSIDTVIAYVLNNPRTRKEMDIAAKVRTEMKKTYGMTINDNPTNGDETISNYFKDNTTKTTTEGQKYEAIDIVIASKQEGGLERYLF